MRRHEFIPLFGPAAVWPMGCERDSYENGAITLRRHSDITWQNCISRTRNCYFRRSYDRLSSLDNGDGSCRAHFKWATIWKRERDSGRRFCLRFSQSPFLLRLFSGWLKSGRAIATSAHYATMQMVWRSKDKKTGGSSAQSIWGIGIRHRACD